MYFLETLHVRAPSHGGVLYSFWYWWNVAWILYWKKQKLKFFNISRFLRVLCYFQHLKKKIFWCKKNCPGVKLFFFKKFCSPYFMFSSLFMLLPTFKFYFLNIEEPLHLLVKWEVVFPNSRYRDSGNLYPIYPLFPCSDFYLPPAP